METHQNLSLIQLLAQLLLIHLACLAPYLFYGPFVQVTPIGVLCITLHPEIKLLFYSVSVLES